MILKNIKNDLMFNAKFDFINDSLKFTNIHVRAIRWPLQWSRQKLQVHWE